MKYILLLLLMLTASFCAPHSGIQKIPRRGSNTVTKEEFNNILTNLQTNQTIDKQIEELFQDERIRAHLKTDEIEILQKLLENPNMLKLLGNISLQLKDVDGETALGDIKFSNDTQNTFNTLMNTVIKLHNIESDIGNKTDNLLQIKETSEDLLDEQQKLKDKIEEIKEESINIKNNIFQKAAGSIRIEEPKNILETEHENEKVIKKAKKIKKNKKLKENTNKHIKSDNVPTEDEVKIPYEKEILKVDEEKQHPGEKRPIIEETFLIDSLYLPKQNEDKRLLNNQNENKEVLDKNKEIFRPFDVRKQYLEENKLIPTSTPSEENKPKETINDDKINDEIEEEIINNSYLFGKKQNEDRRNAQDETQQIQKQILTTDDTNEMLVLPITNKKINNNYTLKPKQDEEIKIYEVTNSSDYNTNKEIIDEQEFVNSAKTNVANETNLETTPLNDLEVFITDDTNKAGHVQNDESNKELSEKRIEETEEVEIQSKQTTVQEPIDVNKNIYLEDTTKISEATTYKTEITSMTTTEKFEDETNQTTVTSKTFDIENENSSETKETSTQKPDNKTTTKKTKKVKDPPIHIVTPETEEELEFYIPEEVSQIIPTIETVTSDQQNETENYESIFNDENKNETKTTISYQDKNEDEQVITQNGDDSEGPLLKINNNTFYIETAGDKESENYKFMAANKDKYIPTNEEIEERISKDDRILLDEIFEEKTDKQKHKYSKDVQERINKDKMLLDEIFEEQINTQKHKHKKENKKPTHFHRIFTSQQNIEENNYEDYDYRNPANYDNKEEIMIQEPESINQNNEDKSWRTLSEMQIAEDRSIWRADETELPIEDNSKIQIKIKPKTGTSQTYEGKLKEKNTDTWKTAEEIQPVQDLGDIRIMKVKMKNKSKNNHKNIPRPTTSKVNEEQLERMLLHYPETEDNPLNIKTREQKNYFQTEKNYYNSEIPYQWGDYVDDFTVKFGRYPTTSTTNPTEEVIYEKENQTTTQEEFNNYYIKDEKTTEENQEEHKLAEGYTGYIDDKQKSDEFYEDTRYTNEDNNSEFSDILDVKLSEDIIHDINEDKKSTTPEERTEDENKYESISQKYIDDSFKNEEKKTYLDYDFVDEDTVMLKDDIIYDNTKKYSEDLETIEKKKAQSDIPLYDYDFEDDHTVILKDDIVQDNLNKYSKKVEKKKKKKIENKSHSDDFEDNLTITLKEDIIHDDLTKYSEELEDKKKKKSQNKSNIFDSIYDFEDNRTITLDDIIHDDLSRSTEELEDKNQSENNFHISGHDSEDAHTTIIKNNKYTDKKEGGKKKAKYISDYENDSKDSLTINLNDAIIHDNSNEYTEEFEDRKKEILDISDYDFEDDHRIALKDDIIQENSNEDSQELKNKPHTYNSDYDYDFEDEKTIKIDNIIHDQKEDAITNDKVRVNDDYPDLHEDKMEKHEDVLAKDIEEDFEDKNTIKMDELIIYDNTADEISIVKKGKKEQNVTYPPILEDNLKIIITNTGNLAKKEEIKLNKFINKIQPVGNSAENNSKKLKNFDNTTDKVIKSTPKNKKIILNEDINENKTKNSVPNKPKTNKNQKNKNSIIYIFDNQTNSKINEKKDHMPLIKTENESEMSDYQDHVTNIMDKTTQTYKHTIKPSKHLENLRKFDSFQKTARNPFETTQEEHVATNNKKIADMLQMADYIYNEQQRKESQSTAKPQERKPKKKWRDNKDDVKREEIKLNYNPYNTFNNDQILDEALIDESNQDAEKINKRNNNSNKKEQYDKIKRKQENRSYQNENQKSKSKEELEYQQISKILQDWNSEPTAKPPETEESKETSRVIETIIDNKKQLIKLSPSPTEEIDFLPDENGVRKKVKIFVPYPNEEALRNSIKTLNSSPEESDSQVSYVDEEYEKMVKEQNDYQTDFERKRLEEELKRILKNNKKEVTERERQNILYPRKENRTQPLNNEQKMYLNIMNQKIDRNPSDEKFKKPKLTQLLPLNDDNIKLTDDSYLSHKYYYKRHLAPSSKTNMYKFLTPEYSNEKILDSYDFLDENDKTATLKSKKKQKSKKKDALEKEKGDKTIIKTIKKENFDVKSKRNKPESILKIIFDQNNLKNYETTNNNVEVKINKNNKTTKKPKKKVRKHSERNTKIYVKSNKQAKKNDDIQPEKLVKKIKKPKTKKKIEATLRVQGS